MLREMESKLIDALMIFARQLPMEMRGLPVSVLTRLVTEGTRADDYELRVWTEVHSCGEWGEWLHSFGECVRGLWLLREPEAKSAEAKADIGAMVADLGKWVDVVDDQIPFAEGANA